MEDPMRTRFDSIALGVISYLESLPEVCGTNFCYGSGVSSQDFSVFQKRHNVQLPDDIKEFYSIFSGISLKWGSAHCGKNILIGDVRINKFDEITVASIMDTRLISRQGQRRIEQPDARSCIAFAIDSSCDVGVVYLVFRSPNNMLLAEVEDMYRNSEIWIQDQSQRWFFICSTFTQYMRLAVMHLGVLGWQAMFIPEGVSEICKSWMDVFCKDRLCIDLYNREHCSALDML